MLTFEEFRASDSVCPLISTQVEKIVTVYVTNDQPNALAPIDAGPVVCADTEFFQDHLLARPEIFLEDATLEMPIFRKDDDNLVFREIPDLKEHIRTLETRFLHSQSFPPLSLPQATFRMGAAGRGTHSAGASKLSIGMSVINPSFTATVGHCRDGCHAAFDGYTPRWRVWHLFYCYEDSTHTHTQSLSTRQRIRFSI